MAKTFAYWLYPHWWYQWSKYRQTRFLVAFQYGLYWLGDPKVQFIPMYCESCEEESRVWKIKLREKASYE